MPTPRITNTHTREDHRSVAGGWLRELGDLLFPTPCLGCGGPTRGGVPALLLCASCAQLLRPPSAEGCRTCGRPLLGSGGGGRCGACRAQPPPWGSLHAAYLYRPPLTQVVRALKYGGGDFLARRLAVELAVRCAPLTGRVDLVTAIPLPWGRLVTRGYNQAAAVARPLARALRTPYRPLLRRRGGRRQARLARAARQQNLRAAFSVGRTPPRGSTVLLVDDVMTTGATLRAASRALLDAGAGVVLVAVAARTPDASWGE